MKNIKKTGVKIIACIVTATLIAGSADFSAAATKVNDIKPDNEAATVSVDTKSLHIPESKDETVYIIANSDGSANKIIVSDCIKDTQEGSLEDKSELSDIVNVKGYESFSQNAEKIVWDSMGEDIYYQGTIEKQLPVDMNIQYFLDGKELSADELSGQSGKLKIRFNFTNNEKRAINIDDRVVEVYVPFVAVTGLMLDNEVFSNVEAVNGKVIDDGNRIVAVGFTLPGMKESLALDDDIDLISDSFEITADVKNFSLVASFTMVTNEVFNTETTDDKLDMSRFDEAVAKLSDAVNQLVEGSSALYDGTALLSDKSGMLLDGASQLNSGIYDLSVGASKLNDGSQTLYNGAVSLDDGVKQLDDGLNKLSTGVVSLNDGSQKLAAGVKQLDDGLALLESNNSALNDGAKTVFETILAMADKQIADAGVDAPMLTIENYGQVLESLSANFDESTIRNYAYNTALNTVTEAVNLQSDVIEAQVMLAVRQQVLDGVLAAAGLNMTSQDYQAAVNSGAVDTNIQEAVQTEVNNQMANDSVAAIINQTVETKKNELIEQNMQSAEVQGKIEEAIQTAAVGRENLAQLKEQLDSYNKFYTGLVQYTAGVSDAHKGSTELLKGALELSGGVSELNYGADQLVTGSAALSSGSSQLTEGASELNNGAGQLNSGAIALYDGSDQLKQGVAAFVGGIAKLLDGSKELSDGVVEFNEEGISKLIDAYNNNINGIADRVKALQELSKEYNNFSGIADNCKGSVKFVYKIDSISSVE